MANERNTSRLVQYGIQTPNSKTILMVTEDLADAEHMLEMVGQGQLIQRTIDYGSWRAVDAHLAAS